MKFAIFLIDSNVVKHLYAGLVGADSFTLILVHS